MRNLNKEIKKIVELYKKHTVLKKKGVDYIGINRMSKDKIRNELTRTKLRVSKMYGQV